MIRFIPDTWVEALLRFFAMAAPDANVYVEIAAPDLRFAAMLLLALAALVFQRRLVGSARPAVALLALLFPATAIWLWTSGNGRYFLPMLLCVGPLTIGLVYLLPLTKAFRLFLAGGLLVAQLFVVATSSPWDAWAWLHWKDAPYFQIDRPAPSQAPQATTYVTISSISYSLIAPAFPDSSRWINLSSVGAAVRDAQWGQGFLAVSKGPIQLVVPSIQGQSGADGGPAPAVREALDVLLAPHRLSLAAQACQLLPSQGLAAIRGKTQPTAEKGREAGFWICPLRYPVDGALQQLLPLSAKVEAAFEKVEQTCPRFLPPASTTTTRVNGGALRHYPHSDMKVYVLDDGLVIYKFWRALNPVVIGTVDEVLSGNKLMDCARIRGRSGLPWNRDI
ncbi:hypothetical protein [uncultured Ramlibacter sp.]|uniref:hypothetical protein n=1 Tax=uncultured Ramlibacter sp. TaxID=260755 RepID=UPI002613662D|nr:hypothetical protein [uncultured Ramlibacter sp.]